MTARTMPTLPTFGSLTVATSAQLGQLVAWNSFWANRPMFRMYQSASQNVVTGTWTQIINDVGSGSAAWDTDSGRSGTSPYSYVIPSGMTGRWRFRWKVGFASNSTGSRLSALYQNGVVANGGQVDEAAASLSTDIPASSLTVLCAAGDTMSVWGYQTSGGTLATDVSNNGALSYFEGSLESLANP